MMLLLALPLARADEAIELARLHTAAIGGKERLQALRSLRANARVWAGDKCLEVTLSARAPNMIRTEARYGDLIIIQGYDGKSAPWQARRGSDACPRQPLPAPAAEALVADADFLDPLVDWIGRGSTLEYAGSALSDTGIVRRIRIATTGRDLVEVWLDSSTYLIVRRLHLRPVQGELSVVIENRFEDFRPVAGVIMPHRLSTHSEGRLLHKTEIMSVTPNPVLPANCFTEP
jgi:hypothetical protein